MFSQCKVQIEISNDKRKGIDSKKVSRSSKLSTQKLKRKNCKQGSEGAAKNGERFNGAKFQQRITKPRRSDMLQISSCMGPSIDQVRNNLIIFIFATFQKNFKV